jgi:hypothetical protein
MVIGRASVELTRIERRERAILRRAAPQSDEHMFNLLITGHQPLVRGGFRRQGGCCP